MKYICEEEIDKLNISPIDMVKWVDETLRAKQDSVLPPKISMKQENHIFYNIMPCIMPSLGLAGVKAVNRYPQREQSLKSNLMLYDYKSGDLKAIMDADWITTWRTAAVAVHSIKLLAVKNYSSIAFLGLGVVGQAILDVYIKTLDKDVSIRILNYKDRAQDIIDKYSSYKNIKWGKYDDYNELVKDCDVVISAVTYTEDDFADAKIYKKGCLLVPVHTRGFKQCDLCFDKIFGDDKGHIEGFEFFDKFKSFNEVSDILNGKCNGRETDEERIIAYNIGIALHDIVFANKIYELVINKK